MTVTNFSKQYKIPKKLTTTKSAPTTTNFAKGIFTYKPNDAMALDEVSLAQNARFDRIGEYKTRHGLRALNVPIGKTTVQDTYAVDYEMQDIDGLELNFSAPTNTYSIMLRVQSESYNENDVLALDIYDSENKLVRTTCIKNVASSPFDREFTFKDGLPTGLSFVLKLRAQGNSKKKYKVAVANGNIMYRLDTAVRGKVGNIFEANIDGVTTLLFTFKSAGMTTLYRMGMYYQPVVIRVLPNGVEHVRFSQNVNKIRYADGKEGPRIIDPTNWNDTAVDTKDLDTEVNLNIKVSNIMSGTQNNMVYFDADTNTQAVWTYPYDYPYRKAAGYTTSATLNEYLPGSTVTSTIGLDTLTPVSSTHPVGEIQEGDIVTDDLNNYGKVVSITSTNVTCEAIAYEASPIESYDGFDRDFRQNFPTIKTGEPLTAMFNLGGIMYFMTRRNKYYQYMQTVDVYSMQASSAQHGTFSQESCVTDLNYAYYANDDGIYIFDGSSEASITQNTIQNTYDAIKTKSNIVLELHNNRLFVFYSSTGLPFNDSCLVYNINLRLWESFDTGLPVSAAIGRQTASNRLICGSTYFGQLFTYDDDENDYADIGSPIDFDLETSYLHFGTPSQLHRITKWRPEFSTVEGVYTIKCGYALDFTNEVKYAFSIDLHNNYILNEHYVWDNPQAYGNEVTPTKLTTIPQVNGQFRRCQIRYQHHAAYEPVNFKSHTLSVETQRIR